MEDKTQDSQGLLYHVISPTGILLGRKEAWPLPEQVAGCQMGTVIFICSTPTGQPCDLRQVPSLPWALASLAITWG